MQWIKAFGFWQLRIWLPRHTLRISCERKNDSFEKKPPGANQGAIDIGVVVGTSTPSF